MKDENIKFLICNQCLGKGFVGDQPCPACSGLGVVIPFYGRFLYWGKKMDTLNIFADRVLSQLNKIINLVLVALGALSIGLLFFYNYETNFSNLISLEYWMTPSSEKALFWIGLILFMHLYYRMALEISPKYRVLRRIFVKNPKLPDFLDWTYLKGQPKNRFVDISRTFDQQAIDFINGAWRLARQMNHRQFQRLHLLAVAGHYDPGALLWGRLGTDVALLKEKLGRVLSWKTEKSGEFTDVSQEVHKVLLNAYILAYENQQRKVTVMDLLFSMFDQKLADTNSSKEDYVLKILIDLELDYQKIYNVLEWQRLHQRMREGLSRFRELAQFKPKNNMDRAMTAVATPYLNRFSEDLTLSARQGNLFPCVGREKELEQIYRILEGTLDGALLVGDAGVGRNAIVEGLAQRMVEETVPENLQDKRLIKISLAQLISGASAAEAEERLLVIANEAALTRNVVVFIDDIHNLIGVNHSEGGLDLSEVLAEVMKKRLFPLIATISPKQYTQFLERSSLRDVFQIVRVEEMDINSAIQVLEAKSGPLEYQNSIYFSYDSIEKAVVLSSKYIHDKYLPDKALDLITTAAVDVGKERGPHSLVTAEDIGRIIAQQTGIKATKVTDSETEQLLNLENELHKRIVGQEDAVNMLSSSLRRARAELRDEKRPIASLLFLGPTGVGKTELAKAVAEVYFGAEDKMLRFDMSEYQEQSSLSRFIGDANNPGQLTEAVRKNPFSLVLFDEIEKAHLDILNIFLQVLDDGRLTDGQGLTVDFTNTIIIMTSNAGAAKIQDEITEGLTLDVIKDRLMNNELRQYFRPELLNRFDGMIVFRPLTMTDIIKIARLLAGKVVKRLAEKEIYLTISDEALAELADLGFDPKFGARPLRRVIQERVDNVLTNALLKNELERRDKATLMPGGELKIIKAEKI